MVFDILTLPEIFSKYKLKRADSSLPHGSPVIFKPDGYWASGLYIDPDFSSVYHDIWFTDNRLKRDIAVGGVGSVPYYDIYSVSFTLLRGGVDLDMFRKKHKRLAMGDQK